MCQGTNGKVPTARYNPPADAGVTATETTVTETPVMDGSDQPALHHAIVVLAPNAWPSNWTARLLDVWRRYGEIPAGRLGRALQPLKDQHTFAEVEHGLSIYLAEGKAQYGPEPFVRAANGWIAGRASTSGASGKDQRSIAAALRFVGGGK